SVRSCWSGLPAVLPVANVLRGCRGGTFAPCGEAGNPAPVNLSDPYQIAFLRGGTLEVARLATLSLLDRGFLHLHGTSLAADEKKPASALKVPIEQQVFGVFASAAEPKSLFSTTSKALFVTQAEKYER